MKMQGEFVGGGALGSYMLMGKIGDHSWKRQKTFQKEKTFMKGIRDLKQQNVMECCDFT